MIDAAGASEEVHGDAEKKWCTRAESTLVAERRRITSEQDGMRRRALPCSQGGDEARRQEPLVVLVLNDGLTRQPETAAICGHEGSGGARGSPWRPRPCPGTARRSNVDEEEDIGWLKTCRARGETWRPWRRSALLKTERDREVRERKGGRKGEQGRRARESGLATRAGKRAGASGVQIGHEGGRRTGTRGWSGGAVVIGSLGKTRLGGILDREWFGVESDEECGGG